jgi:hypothetical protein
MRVVPDLHEHFIGWLWCPADSLLAAPPTYPCRRPLTSRYPNPAFCWIKEPAPVVIDCPSPVSLTFITDPIPSPIIGIDPMTAGVGRPITFNVSRCPHVPPAVIVSPMAVGFQGCAELDSHIDLGVNRRRHTSYQHYRCEERHHASHDGASA